MELGQMMFGNPTGDYNTEEFADALIEALLTEIERVFWNKNQEQWDRYCDPNIPNMEFRPYDWSEDGNTTSLPNLKFHFSPQEIRWYKHAGRGNSCTLNMTRDEWADWFHEAMDLIRKHDVS